MSHCIVVRHVPFESLDRLAPMLERRGLSLRQYDAPIALPTAAELAAAAIVVVLGGPIGVYEEQRYPFLTDELRLLEGALQRQQPLLGICLGAQLMARALGERVYPGNPELGWSPVELTSAGRASVLVPIEGLPVLHWHGDTFDLPPTARLLACTQATPNQAFQLENHAIGLQFHLEVSPAQLEAWYVGHTHELSQPGKPAITELRAAGRAQGALLAPGANAALEATLELLLSAHGLSAGPL